ncbi:hypothetical protein [Streptomyces sp. NPDC047928]|uniref:hypothetical protein n=1 Tax=unclassified Streptomyces TaxID=2593676 RepID=UPI003717B45B
MKTVFSAAPVRGLALGVCGTESPSGRHLTVDAGAVNRELVLENDVVVGSVNAGMTHYQQAAEALAAADVSWLRGLISRRVPLDLFREAFTRRDDDVKVVITLDGTAG